MTDHAPLEARRDRLHLELTAAWARIARREARPEEIAAYYAKQAEYQMACDFLAEEEKNKGTPGAFDPWPVCPECEGAGSGWRRRCGWPIDYLACPACNGTGVLDDTNSRTTILETYVSEWEEGQR